MFDALFPRLNQSGFSITSFASPRYNCVAWAAGEQHRWWEPDPLNMYYWPPGTPREYTIAAYVNAFESLGYVQCTSSDLEDGHLKVAVYALAGRLKHVARQTNEGKWTSKLGKELDLEHTLDGLEGPTYGSVVQILKRRAVA